MVTFSDRANNDLRAAKRALEASDADMAQLNTDIRDWVRRNHDGTQRFPIGRLRNHGVKIHVTNDEVTWIEYGDV